MRNFFHQAEETMNGQEIRDRLLHSYERSYDIVKPSEVNGHTYDACASYHESGAKYVLSKKAELWRISCHEHAYFKAVEELNDQDVETFLTDLTEWFARGRKYRIPTTCTRWSPVFFLRTNRLRTA